MTIGDRAFTRYIKHPSSGLFADGNPLSSWLGEVLLISNPNHLAQVSCRHIGSLVLPSTYASVPAKSNSAAAWENVNSPQPLPATNYNAIPWDRSTSIKMGPFPLILDVNSDGVANPRKVVCKFHLEVGGGAAVRNLYAALTQSGDGRSPASGAGLASGTTTTLTGTVSATITLTPALTRAQGAYVTDQWTCRNGIGTSDDAVMVMPCYVWFGWMYDDGSTRIQSLTAHEVR
jgi:hypothetical protein